MALDLSNKRELDKLDKILTDLSSETPTEWESIDNSGNIQYSKAHKVYVSQPISKKDFEKLVSNSDSDNCVMSANGIETCDYTWLSNEDNGWQYLYVVAVQYVNNKVLPDYPILVYWKRVKLTPTPP